jgi:DNA-directed RNA polymerase specialized sigma24 family protein
MKLLSTASAQTRAVVALVVEGYEHREIADMLSITARAAEGCAYRFRRKVLEAAYRGRITVPDGVSERVPGGGPSSPM